MEVSTPASGVQLAVTISGAEYALPVSEVESVIFLRRSAVSTVPFDTSGRLRGIFSHNGGVVAIIHREGLTARADLEGSEELTAVILNDGSSRLALIVDSADVMKDTDASKRPALLSTQMLYSGETDNDDKRQ